MLTRSRYGGFVVAAHLRRRSMFLVLIGLIYVVHGFSLILDPLGDLYITNVLPGAVPGLAWAVGGAGAVIAGMLPPRTWEPVGFTSLYIVSGAWCVMSVVSGVLNNADGAFRRATIWLIVIVMIMLVAGWRENVTEKPRRRREPREP